MATASHMATLTYKVERKKHLVNNLDCLSRFWVLVSLSLCHQTLMGINQRNAI